MPHEITRVLAAAAGSVWAIDPSKGMEIANMLALRAAGQPRDWAGDQSAAMPISQSFEGRRGTVHVLQLHGTIFPRANMMTEMSGGATLTAFGRAFDEAAADERASAIVLDIDSPGGVVTLVEETAAKIFAARRPDRPIVAVANHMAGSAAYWIASAADQIVAPPSAVVGSIGVYTMHDNLAGALELAGIDRTTIHEGARKVETLPYGPLDDAARRFLQSSVADTYRSFTGDVARFRGVAPAVVRADPESADAHYGGGRAYHARQARQLGMIDRVASMDEVLSDLAQGKRLPRRGGRRANLRGRKMALY